MTAIAEGLLVAVLVVCLVALFVAGIGSQSRNTLFDPRDR